MRLGGLLLIVRMWNSITGSWRPGLPLWDSVGPSSSRTATAHCAVASFTGGPRVMTQWRTTEAAQDFDITCPGVNGTTPTWSPLYAYRSTILRVGSTGSAVKAIHIRLAVTPTAHYGNVARSKVIELQRAHGLRQTGVMTAAEWKAAGPSSSHPPGPRPWVATSCSTDRAVPSAVCCQVRAR
ncbi:peptidoglycan-binding protein [Pedococcus sp. KACC 23699]|uniref:peptidoglycan-binding domain-containing protein n=1 Tax=Pedococcus sp. KACC 23699 TaxID=3149228 RepID=UPI00387808FB